MTDLSPAAQAVYDAVLEICPAPADEIAAAALEAVAEQVVYFPGRYSLNEYMQGLKDARENVRRELLAIAAELRAQ